VFARESAIFGARFDVKTLKLASNPMSIVGDLSMNSTTGAALFTLSTSGTLVYRARVTTFAQRQMIWVTRSGAEEAVSEDRRPYLEPRTRRSELRRGPRRPLPDAEIRSPFRAATTARRPELVSGPARSGVVVFRRKPEATPLRGVEAQRSS